MSWSKANALVTSRRDVLGGAAGLATLLAGASQIARAASPPANEPWKDDGAGVQRGSQAMASAARAFLSGLDADQRAKAWYRDLGDSARTKWSNLPAGFSPRPGVANGDLSDVQRVLLHALLRASTSSQGYLKMTGAIRAEDVLHDLQGGDALFGSANYFASVFGTPDGPDWAWMLTGHHMSAIFTVAGHRTSFTPMFTGSQPLQIPSGLHAGWQVLPHDAGWAGALLASLSADQKAVAVIGDGAPGDLLAGPGRQASLERFQGIPARALDAAQQRLLWLLVEEFVRDADVEAAEAHLALVRTGWPDTHFAWQGPAPDPAARYYFRVHGPRILIEYDVQEPLTNRGGHVHAVTRDPLNDYGMDWLGLHYHEPAAFPDGPRGPGGPFGPGMPPPGPPPAASRG